MGITRTKKRKIRKVTSIIETIKIITMMVHNL